MIRAAHYLLAAIFVGAMLLAIGIVLNRIDRAAAQARRAEARVVAHDATLESLAQHANVITTLVQGVNSELALCRRRTNGLQQVMTMLVQSAVRWPDRVRLPVIDGWEWPSIRGEGEEDAR